MTLKSLLHTVWREQPSESAPFQGLPESIVSCFTFVLKSLPLGWIVSVLEEMVTMQLLSSALLNSLFGSSIFHSQICTLFQKVWFSKVLTRTKSNPSSQPFELEPPELCKQQTYLLYKVILPQVFKYSNEKTLEKQNISIRVLVPWTIEQVSNEKGRFLI